MSCLILLAMVVVAQKSTYSDSKLVVAIRHNDLAAARKLLASGARADLKSESQVPPILEAMRAPTSYRAKGSVEPMVRLLLSHGAKADAIDGFGWCALTLASPDVSLGLITTLLDNGADPNRVAMHGDPALCRFSAYGRLDVVKVLIERGAKVNEKGYFGQNALDEAARSGKVELLQYLFSKGAQISSRSGQMTLLHYAAQSEKNNSEMFTFLVANGFSVVTRNAQRMTPLHEAAMAGNLSNVAWLLNHGANRNARNDKGQTPADVALATQKQFKTDRSKVIRLLRP